MIRPDSIFDTKHVKQRRLLVGLTSHDRAPSASLSKG
jgi:hypothetical protein